MTAALLLILSLSLIAVSGMTGLATATTVLFWRLWSVAEYDRTQAEAARRQATRELARARLAANLGWRAANRPPVADA